ncbi:MAG: hypothetical protein QOK08_2620 [Actinomycetota bacterium]|nr:hypothetical protein [Actinomycetota bacterium]
MTRRKRTILIDAELHLLDRQVLDVDEVPIIVVSEVELTDIEFDKPIPPNASAPTITALLSGPVLVTRIFGGKPPRSRLHTIDWKVVSKIGIVISLRVKGSTLDVTWGERWISEHVIRRIPGGKNDPH